MSNRPQPTRNQVIMQQVLLMIVVFLGFNMFCNNRPQGPVDNRGATQILGNVANPVLGAPPTPKPGENWDMTQGTLAWANASLLDLTSSEVYSRLKSRLGDDLKAKKITQGEADRLELQGLLLVADAQLKAGIQRNDTNRLRSAFYTLSGYEGKHRDDPLWTSTSFQIPPTVKPHPEFDWRQITGQQLYEKVVADLSEHNKHDVVYGVFPGYQIIDFLVGLTGKQPYFSYAFAAFLLALIVRAIIYPVAQRQLMWSRKMQQLAPLVKEIREQYTDKKTKQVTNQAEFQQRTMALYQEYGINPLAGCVPAFIQFPLFITVYQFMLHYQFEFQKGYFLWVNPATSRATNGFFAPNLGLIDHTMIVVYGITMIISTLLMPVSDPTQVRQQKLIGVGIGLLFTVFMFTGAFPVPGAFVLYWTFTNLLATAQAYRAYHLPMPPLEKVNTRMGGVFPMKPFGGDDRGAGGGGANGKPSNPITPAQSTGTPAKHKPKKRK